jgi:hypothetical protein
VHILFEKDGTEADFFKASLSNLQQNLNDFFFFVNCLFFKSVFVSEEF